MEFFFEVLTCMIERKFSIELKTSINSLKMELNIL